MHDRSRTPRLHALARVCLLLLPLAACGEDARGYYQGYVEGEYVYVASSLAGDLMQLDVTRGHQVQAGAPLFSLDPDPQTLRLEETRQRKEQARARLADLEKGMRPSELAALEARLGRARSGLELAQRDHARRREFFEAGDTDVVSEEELDRFATEVEARAFDVASLEAELETARLGGRADAVAAAGQEVKALDASLRQLDWQLAEKRVAAPGAGLVQDTLFRVGEFVPAGRPVVVLLPPENLKVRFFVPQEALPTIRRGDLVQLHADGLERRIRAVISFISPEAEFTPPVIYSKESRSKLVFMIEAVPDEEQVRRLRPGQPLEVHLD